MGKPHHTLRAAFLLTTLAWLGSSSAADTRMTITLEGQTHELDAVSLRDSTVTEKDGQLQFYLTQADHPVSLNLNLARTEAVAQGAARFQLSDANQGSVVVDLNFFNRDRPGRRMGKRILFTEGSIEIDEVSTTSLRMAFKGFGHPLMDNGTRFPIEGSVNVQGMRVVTEN